MTMCLWDYGSMTWVKNPFYPVLGKGVFGLHVGKLRAYRVLPKWLKGVLNDNKDS